MPCVVIKDKTHNKLKAYCAARQYREGKRFLIQDESDNLINIGMNLGLTQDIFSDMQQIAAETGEAIDDVIQYLVAYYYKNKSTTHRQSM